MFSYSSDLKIGTRNLLSYDNPTLRAVEVIVPANGNFPFFSLEVIKSAAANHCAAVKRQCPVPAPAGAERSGDPAAVNFEYLGAVFAHRVTKLFVGAT